MYKIYKGVQKPIMFKGLKGRFIYIAGGVLGSSLVLVILLSSFFGFLIAAAVGLGIGGSGMFLILKKQNEGLNAKDKKQGVFIVKNKLSKF